MDAVFSNSIRSSRSLLRHSRSMENHNTIENFSQSWQRATRFRASFSQDQHVIPGLYVDEDDDDAKQTLYWPTFASDYGSIKHDGVQKTAYLTVPHTASAFGRHVADETGLIGKEDELYQQGKSTVYMTIFNCTNMLIGAGILALPFGIQQCGWIVGLMLLKLPALVTAYTAKLLVKCLESDPAAITYSDIAHLAFGRAGRQIVEVLFSSELVAANVALVVLFSDSVVSLTPILSKTAWKMIFALGLIPLNFLPLQLLSLSSAIGIFCFIGILTVILTCGFLKPTTPGSLLETARTEALPVSWKAVPAAFGIFMAPWGGHSIIPAVYKDMRHPHKYPRALKWTYGATYSIAFLIGIAGYLMFGDGTLTEITSNILRVEEYPQTISMTMLVLVTLVPLTKIALTNRPVVDTLTRKLGIHHSMQQSFDDDTKSSGQRRRAGKLGRLTVGAFCNILELALACLIPNFDDVVATMGSALCITVCIVLPSCFYLKICRDRQLDMLTSERVACWTLIIVGTVFAVLGCLFVAIQAY